MHTQPDSIEHHMHWAHGFTAPENWQEEYLRERHAWEHNKYGDEAHVRPSFLRSRARITTPQDEHAHRRMLEADVI